MMNCGVLIFCLFVAANIEYGAFGYEFDVNHDSYDENLDGEQRWYYERQHFMEGLPISDPTSSSHMRTLTLKEFLIPNNTNVSLEDVKFMLYTRRNPIIPQIMGFENALKILPKYYVRDAPTMFIAHGFLNNGYMTACREIQDAALRKYNMNVIVIDWSSIAMNFKYHEVAARVHKVALIVTMFMNYIVTEGYLNYNLTIMAGHSLGAHVVGIAGYNAGKVPSERPKVIFGLDPALPLFKYAGPKYRISFDSGVRVQIIHTNPGFLGTNEMWGKQSFFMSGISGYQNGCWDRIGLCSHDRAFYYYAESITSTVGFYGRECDNDKMFRTGNCTGKKIARMGGILTDTSLNAHELYTVEVNPSPPFAKGHPFPKERVRGVLHKHYMI